MPITPTLTSSSVHHSSHQLTTTFLSYYNVTLKTFCAEKWRKAMIYYYYYYSQLPFNALLSPFITSLSQFNAFCRISLHFNASPSPFSSSRFFNGTSSPFSFMFLFNAFPFLTLLRRLYCLYIAISTSPYMNLELLLKLKVASTKIWHRLKGWKAI